MKYFKLILLFIFIITFSSLFAVDLLKEDETVIVPELEPLKIDLEAIKNRSSVRKNIPVIKKKIKDSKPAKVKKSKSAGTGKKSDSKKIKSKKKKPVQGTSKQSVKSVKTGRKSLPESKKSEDGSKLPVKNENIVNANVSNQGNKISDNTKSDTIPFRSDLIIINPLDGNPSINRLDKINYTEIARWAKSQGLNLKADAPPVIDDVAFFTPDYFAEFKIEGYDRNREYRLYIDFVRFDRESAYFNSLIKILGRDSKGKMYLIAEVNRQRLKENKIFETLIPYELSYPGRFDIIVREFSDTPGKWGIWDMIITDKKIDRIDIIKPDRSEKIKEIVPKIFD